MFITSEGNIYHGIQGPNSVSINDKPSGNYKLKENWQSFIPDVWEFDSTSARSKLIQKVKDNYDNDHQELIFRHYPKYEPFSWNDQRDEASKWNSLSDAEKDTSITNLDLVWLFNACYPDGGEIDKQVVSDFANKIIDNAEQFKQAASKLLGKKRKEIATIQAADENGLKDLCTIYKI